MKAYNVVDLTGPVTVNGPPSSGDIHGTGAARPVDLQRDGRSEGARRRECVNAADVRDLQLFRNSQAGRIAVGHQWNMCAGALTPQFTLPTDGVYTLLVDPAGSQTGSVTARVIDPVVMVNGTAPPTGITVAPSTVVSVQVIGGTGQRWHQVCLSVVGSSSSSYLAWKSVPTSGAAVSFTMPSTPGSYQFRLFANGADLDCDEHDGDRAVMAAKSAMRGRKVDGR